MVDVEPVARTLLIADAGEGAVERITKPVEGDTDVDAEKGDWMRTCEGIEETGADLRDRFVADDADSARFFRPAARDGHFMFDLAGYVAARLAAAGVGTIEDLDACTYADEEQFFSYRRMTHRGEADYGRHVNAIMLEE